MDRAVLLVAHGTVEDLDELPAFLRNIRRGHEAPPELLAETRRRYEVIGGRSPLTGTTRSLARKLEARLGVPVRAGMRLWKPFVRDALAELVRNGARRVAVLPLAQFSTRVYGDAVRRAAKELAHEGGAEIELRVASDWGSDPALVALFARLVRLAVAELTEAERARTVLLVTAHSLPTAVIAAGDAYATEFQRGARAVAEAVRDVLPEARVGYQSEGASGGEWLGPGLRASIDAIAAEKRFDRVLIAPVGFLADHVETLYDLDIEARGWARERGLELVRTALPNDRDEFVEVLAGLAGPLLAGPSEPVETEGRR
jgi:ferrochelatase